MKVKKQSPVSSNKANLYSWFWWGSILAFSMVVGRIGYDISMSRGVADVDNVSLVHAYLTAFFYFLMAAFAGAIVGESLPPLAKWILGTIPLAFVVLYLYGAF